MTCYVNWSEFLQNLNYHSKVGSFVPALKHFSEIHAELKNLYGEEHPRTLGCREDIANCLRRTKVYTLFCKKFRKSFFKKKRLLISLR